MSSDKINAFKNLNKHNDLALEQLARFSQQAACNQEGIDSLFSHISKMYSSVYSLAPIESPYFRDLDRVSYRDLLRESMRSIKAESKEAIRRVPDQSVILSPYVLEEILTATSRKLLHLNPELEGMFPSSFSPHDLRTPHDLIRYFHQTGTEFLFDPNGDTWSSMYASNSTHYSAGGLEMKFISVQDDPPIAEQLEQNPLTKRLTDIADSSKFKSKKNNFDHLYILSDVNILSIQMALGLHYATMKIVSQEDERYHLNFHYTDTRTYSSSSFRTKLTENILKIIGYSVTRNEHILDANIVLENQEQAADCLENTLRLAVSLRDVDTVPFQKTLKRVGDATKAFNAGVMNLSRYLENCSRREYKKFAKDHGIYSQEGILFPNSQKGLELRVDYGNDMEDDASMSEDELLITKQKLNWIKILDESYIPRSQQIPPTGHYWLGLLTVIGSMIYSLATKPDFSKINAPYSQSAPQIEHLNYTTRQCDDPLGRAREALREDRRIHNNHYAASISFCSQDKLSPICASPIPYQHEPQHQQVSSSPQNQNPQFKEVSSDE